MRSLKWKVGSLLLALASSAALAAPGTITTTLTPAAVLPGDQFTVTLRITGYTDAAEIDGFNFRVTYSTNVFSIVTNSFDLGAASGPDQQWLSKGNQEGSGAGYSLTSFNNDSTPGLVIISMADLGYNSPERGALANSGFLIAFKLQATCGGTGNIVPQAYFGGTVLFDTNLVATGVPSFTGATMVISNLGPTLSISRLSTNVFLSWPAPSAGFLLECATNLRPPAVWQSVTNPVVITNSQNTVTIPALGARFYRLRCPF